MKKILKDHENRIVGIVLLITIILAISPLISRYCINGHDLEYHLLRIEALKENILIGRPFLKVNTLFFGGAGYASSMFYSDFLLYIPAILRVLGVSINSSYHIFEAICIILCLLSTYYCVYKMTDSKYAGVIAGMLITLCPYHMDDLMVRSAVGEYTAFIFVPFALYGIYNVVYEEMSKPYILAIGFGGVLLCHTATTLMIAMFAVAFFAVKIKTFIKNPKLIIRLAATAVVTALVTASYYLPMLEQFISTRFSVSKGGSIDMLDAAVDFSQVLSNQFPTIGICLIVLAIPRVFIAKKGEKLIDFADWMLLAAALFCILSTNVMPWRLLEKVISFVQFPWRFFLIGSVLLAMADGIIIYTFVKNIAEGQAIGNLKDNLIWGAVISLIFIYMSSFAMIHQSENAQGYYDYSNDFYSYKPYTCSVIGGEWLPEGVNRREDILPMSEILSSDTGDKLEFIRDRGAVICNVDKEYEYVDVPFIYYKGYKASIVDAQGVSHKLIADAGADNGFTRVYLNNNTGLLNVSYRGTTVQLIAYVLTILGIVVTGIIIIKDRKNK